MALDPALLLRVVSAVLVVFAGAAGVVIGLWQERRDGRQSWR